VRVTGRGVLHKFGVVEGSCVRNALVVCLKKAKRFDVDVVFECQVVLGFGLSCTLRCVGEGDTAPKGVALLYKTEYKTKVLIRSLFTAEKTNPDSHH